jgi:hypothetical protein
MVGVRAVSVGTRLFTAIGVLLIGAGVVGWTEDPSALVTAVLSTVAALAVAFAFVAAFHGSRDSARPDPHEGDVEASLLAPVSYPAATVVAGGAASTVGVTTSHCG